MMCLDGEYAGYRMAETKLGERAESESEFEQKQQRPEDDGKCIGEYVELLWNKVDIRIDRKFFQFKERSYDGAEKEEGSTDRPARVETIVSTGVRCLTEREARVG